MVSQRVGVVHEGIVHAHRGDSGTTVKFAWIEILSVGILQLLSDAADSNTLAVVKEHLRIACSITAVSVEAFPSLTGFVIVFEHIVLLVPCTIRFLRIGPIDHLHVVRIEIIEEHRFGRGITNFNGKTVGSEGVAVDSTRCLTFIRASDHEGHCTNDYKKEFLHYSAA